MQITLNKGVQDGMGSGLGQALYSTRNVVIPAQQELKNCARQKIKTETWQTPPVSYYIIQYYSILFNIILHDSTLSEITGRAGEGRRKERVGARKREKSTGSPSWIGTILGGCPKDTRIMRRHSRLSETMEEASCDLTITHLEIEWSKISRCATLRKIL